MLVNFSSCLILSILSIYIFFFFNDTATTEIYTLHIVGSVRCVQETVSTQSTWEGAYINKLGKDITELDLTTQKLYRPYFKHYCNSEKTKDGSTIYFTYDSLEISSNDIIQIENTSDEYELGISFKAESNMQVKIGLLCCDKDKKEFNSSRVFIKGDPVRYVGYDKSKGMILVEKLQNKQDCSSWSKVEQFKSCNGIGFYIDGQQEYQNPQSKKIYPKLLDLTITSMLENEFFICYTQTTTNSIKLSQGAKEYFEEIMGQLIPKKTLIANYEVLDESFHIMLDMPNLHASSDQFEHFKIRIKDEGRAYKEIYKNNEHEYKSMFWPQTKFVRILIYTNWVDNKKKQERAKTSFKNVYFRKVKK
eukprot:TRINITY_DN35171_c0_g1_i2.p1 TRINITY_DN35171_c0_g1~~TRINITY_DN35171_c0_g1_i2.p1  ORF type:complete len:362 (+),score=93.25 TRINITY_DN35171_c0_g1_i2:38-1123(+)